MSEEPEMIANNTTGDIAEVRTAADLAIEELRAEISAMKEAHAAEVAEMRKANAGLWSKLHPVETPTVEPEPEEGAVFVSVVDKAFGVIR